MSINEEIIRAFAEQFTPPLTVCKTDKINNVPMKDAWQASYWDSARSIGITSVAHSSGLHAFLEAAGPAEIASDAGQVLAKALGLFNAPPVPAEFESLGNTIAKSLFHGVNGEEPVIGQWTHPSVEAEAEQKTAQIIAKILHAALTR